MSALTRIQLSPLRVCLTSAVYGHGNGPHENWYIEFVKKIRATVPIPAERDSDGDPWVYTVSLTIHTMVKHVAIRIGEIQNVGLRLNRSLTRRMYRPHMTTVALEDFLTSIRGTLTEFLRTEEARNQ
jgi:hypothetical protein